MDNFERDGDTFEVSIPLDATGMLGHECPNDECLGYFKVEPGTGLIGDDLTCTCPYCGTQEDPDHFWTQEQIEYAQSIVLREVMKDFDSGLKKLERRPRPGAWFSIGITVEAAPIQIARYAEKELETDLVCDSCTLHYSIYGVFGYCPDCRAHNSLQILRKNLEIATKMAGMVDSLEEPLKRAMMENAVQSVVAAFDAFGREVCRRFAGRATDPRAAESVSFQSLLAASNRVRQLFGLDMTGAVSDEQWREVLTLFQKRHLLAHNGGVVDAKYMTATGDQRAVVGRKIDLSAAQILKVSQALDSIAVALYAGIAARSVDQT